MGYFIVMFTFLHAADIHLDSPLRNLSLDDQYGTDLLRGASRRAFDRLIDAALEREVAFLLLAGDLYDGDWRDYNTGLFFIDRMRRLRQAGIRVFIAAGNHDAATVISRSLPLPDNVHWFSCHTPESVSIDSLNLAVHGFSHPNRHYRNNPIPDYPAPIPGMFNIGLLHTALTGRPGHEPYAPCTTAELIHKGYDYWALGHVHSRDIIHEDPWIVFPGCLQGRHIRETGPHGATLIRVDNGRVSGCEELHLDVARWQLLDIDLSGKEQEEELISTVRESLADASDGSSQPLVVRICLRGRLPLHGELLARSEHWRQQFVALALDLGDILIEELDIKTRPLRRPDAETVAGSPVAALLRDSPPDPALLESDILKHLTSRLPDELALIPDNQEERNRLLEEIRTLVTTRILAGEES